MPPRVKSFILAISCRVPSGIARERFATTIIVARPLSGKVDVGHIAWVADFQEGDTFQLVPGLTLKNLDPNHFSKMKVKTSLNLLSNRLAATLKYLALKGIVPEEFEATAWFIKLMNRWFQLMTSRNLYHALGLRNMDAYNQALEHLQLVVMVFRNMSVGSDGYWKPVQSHVVFATMAILEIQKFLIYERGHQFIQTSTFGCDVVENVNSSVRVNNPNLTPLEFKNKLKKLTISQFNMKINSSSRDYAGCGEYVDLLFYPTAPSPAVQIDPSTFKWFVDVPPPTQPPEDDVFHRYHFKKRNILKCAECIEKLRNIGETPHPNALFQILTDFSADAQFAVNDYVFKLFKLIEFNLQVWLPKLEKVQSLDCLIDAIVIPGTSHMTLPSCRCQRKNSQGFYKHAFQANGCMAALTSAEEYCFIFGKQECWS
ncbi:Transposable element P transposase [Frankliniella fusca]|uniref:Transposable element P transposase n=1 Tax=Frankliniella fusca TaxID=407009 RepID=A0AAE1H411_9NEOP|nr:Transposable element P transposase [Frankliniella fusca]